LHFPYESYIMDQIIRYKAKWLAANFIIFSCNTLQLDAACSYHGSNDILGLNLFIHSFQQSPSGLTPHFLWNYLFFPLNIFIASNIKLTFWFMIHTHKRNGCPLLELAHAILAEVGKILKNLLWQLGIFF
jgi:hypothetical protein